MSYKVNEKTLLNSVDLPLKPGNIYIVGGIENTAYMLLGGLIARLFPIKEKLEWPQVQALIENYMGELFLEEGDLPSSSFYVGVDPDRHLMFSRVEEEFISQNIEPIKSKESLNNLGLDESFLERQISDLSGGEKMRVALAIAFSEDYYCYVLHGVIPWLDKNGRELLIKQIKSKKNNSCVVLLDHEIDLLKNFLTVTDFGGEHIDTLQVKLKPLNFAANCHDNDVC
jgi:energy-coupling factor transporter ATP-binding protein EcfA2